MYQYYYKDNRCKAKQSTDKGCICWHNEGSLPFPTYKHDEAHTTVAWRELTNHKE